MLSDYLKINALTQTFFSPSAKLADQAMNLCAKTSHITSTFYTRALRKLKIVNQKLCKNTIMSILLDKPYFFHKQ